MSVSVCVCVLTRVAQIIPLDVVTCNPAWRSGHIFMTIPQSKYFRVYLRSKINPQRISSANNPGHSQEIPLQQIHPRRSPFISPVQNVFLNNSSRMPAERQRPWAVCFVTPRSMWIFIFYISITEHFRGVFTTRRYTNPRLPLQLPLPLL